MPIARGRAWLDEIVSGTASIEAIAARQKCSVRHVNMTISIRFDQCGTSLRLHWPRARSCGRGWKQDLLEPLGWRLCPGDQQRGVFFDRGRWIRGLACALLTGVHQPKRQMAVADLDASDHGSLKFNANVGVGPYSV